VAKAKLISIFHPKHSQTMAEILLKGGIVGALWGHHLYFLACNAYDLTAVKKLNNIKGRPKNQVLVSPGAIEEVEEFVDIKKSNGLFFAAKEMGMKPLAYLEFLFKKFPLGVELFANDQVPSSITFETLAGKTIWLAAHMGDKNYSKLLQAVRQFRREGKNVVFAGTSLNLPGESTLTVKQLDKVIEHFAGKVDAISIHPKGDKLKKLNFSISCSVVSFIGDKPKLLRVGSVSETTLKKYIPDLQISAKI